MESKAQSIVNSFLEFFFFFFYFQRYNITRVKQTHSIGKIDECFFADVVQLFFCLAINIVANDSIEHDARRIIWFASVRHL